MGLFYFLFGKKKIESIKPTPSYGRPKPTAINAANLSNNSINTQIDKLVKQCINLEIKSDIQGLQNALFQLYGYFNKPGGGKYILNYNDKLNLGLCFAFMLRYDWMGDADIREVWAENGFYCIQEYLDHQKNGVQGQVEGMIILFTLLCVGRNSLKPKIQNILDRGKLLSNPIFHKDDYKKGAQNIIDQLSLLAVSGIRDMGQAGIPIMMQVMTKYNGTKFFEETIRRTDLMKYDVHDVVNKIRFIRDVIGSILRDM